MPSRFEFERAVRRSGLPPLSRLLALTLATWAEVDTAVIPEDHQPAQSVLLQATGMAKGTFLSHRTNLVKAGWISYASPTVQAARRDHEQCVYAIHIPAGARSGADLAKGAETRTSKARSGADLGQEMTQPGSGDDPAKSDESEETEARSAPDLGQGLTTRVPGESGSTSSPSRLDVEQVCRYLADRIEANGSKRPPITKEWRTQARLLIDKDGRTVEQILRAIDWCQADPFWRSNVMCMPKLRKQYDRLRLKATEERDRERARQQRQTQPQNREQSLADRGVF